MRVHPLRRTCSSIPSEAQPEQLFIFKIQMQAGVSLIFLIKPRKEFVLARKHFKRFFTNCDS